MLKIVTFNIRTLWDHDYDGINSFIHRIGLIYEKIRAERADVIAFQEMTEKHYDVLQKLLPEYVFVGSGRCSCFDGEGLYTAYLKDAFVSVSNRIFWISDTPEIPESKFENQSKYPRICVSTRLYHKESRRTICIYNVHLDYLEMFDRDVSSSDGRMNPRALGIKRVIAEMEKDPVNEEKIILGDFNALYYDAAVSICRSAGLCDLTENVEVSFHDFGKFENSTKIDYIFATDGLAKLAGPAVAWREERHGIYLSDHYPISCEIDI